MSRCASKTSKGSSASQSCFFQWSFKCTSNNIVEKSPNIPKLRLKFVSYQKPQHSIVFPALFLLHFHTHTHIYTRTIIICPAEFRICFEAYTPSKRNQTHIFLKICFVNILSISLNIFLSAWCPTQTTLVVWLKHHCKSRLPIRLLKSIRNPGAVTSLFTQEEPGSGDIRSMLGYFHAAPEFRQVHYSITTR